MSEYTQIDRDRTREVTEREAKRSDDQTPASAKLYETAKKTLALGVSSTYQVHHPWPIYFSRGKDSRAWDIGGNEYIDFHNGFGSMIQGHAHPAITEAIKKRVALRTHFAAPVEDTVVVSQELAKRWGCLADATPTPVPRPRWTPSALRAPTQAATTS